MAGKDWAKKVGGRMIGGGGGGKGKGKFKGKAKIDDIMELLEKIADKVGVSYEDDDGNEYEKKKPEDKDEGGDYKKPYHSNEGDYKKPYHKPEENDKGGGGMPPMPGM